MVESQPVAAAHNSKLWKALVVALCVAAAAFLVLAVASVENYYATRSAVHELRAEEYARCLANNKTNATIPDIINFLAGRRARAGMTLTQDELDEQNAILALVPSQVDCKNPPQKQP